MDVIIVGHTHAPLVRLTASGKSLFNPGTLMREAKDGSDSAARPAIPDCVFGTFGVFDTVTTEFKVRRLGVTEPADVKDTGTGSMATGSPRARRR